MTALKNTLIILSICGTIAASAQETTGGIVGTVTSEDGMALPGATVKLADPERGLQRSVLSNEGGIYKFGALAPGRYELTEERCFLNPVRLESFAQFRHGILDATHTQHNVSDELLLRVQDKFESFAPTSAHAPYYFETPNRVDLLRAL